MGTCQHLGTDDYSAGVVWYGGFSALPPPRSWFVVEGPPVPYAAPRVWYWHVDADVAVYVII